MKSNEEVLRELKIERYTVMNKMNKITDFKLNNTDEFIKLGSRMCTLIDIQYYILASYNEVLTARIIALKDMMMTYIKLVMIY